MTEILSEPVTVGKMVSLDLLDSKPSICKKKKNAVSVKCYKAEYNKTSCVCILSENTVFSSFMVLLSTVLVIHSQPRSEHIKWKIQEMNDS